MTWESTRRVSRADPAREIVDRIAEALSPSDGTLDSEASRTSISWALCEFMRREPEADLLALTLEQIALAMELFIGADICSRIELDVGKTILDRAPDPATAVDRFQEMKRYVRQVVAACFRRRLTNSGPLSQREAAQLGEQSCPRYVQRLRGFSVMRVICQQNPAALDPTDGVSFSLFEQPGRDDVGRVAATIPQDLRRAGVYPSAQAWDFLAVSLSVAAADFGCLRSESPDGWTRNIQLEVAVTDSVLWNTQATALNDRASISDRRHMGTHVCSRWNRSTKGTSPHQQAP